MSCLFVLFVLFVQFVFFLISSCKNSYLYINFQIFHIEIFIIYLTNSFFLFTIYTPSARIGVSTVSPGWRT